MCINQIDENVVNCFFDHLRNEEKSAAKKTVPATGEHNYVDGVCTECGDKDEASVPAEPIKPAIPSWKMWLKKWLDQMNGKEECEHSYASEVCEPTCTEQGYTAHTCEKCGDSYKDSYTDAVGHDYENGICTACGEHEPHKPTRPSWGNLWDWLFKHR